MKNVKGDNLSSLKNPGLQQQLSVHTFAENLNLLCFLHPYSDPERRAGDSLFIRFPSGFTVAAVLPPTSSNTEKAARGFPFLSSISRKPARRASRVLIFPLSPLLRVWAPASGALALYYILQTYIIMYV